MSSKYITSASETVYVVDWMTGAMKQIDSDHAYIHQGIFFEVSINKTITPSGTYNIVLQTPSTDYIHFRPANIATSGDKLTISLHEDCTATGGATVASYNHNRTKTAVATMTVITSATITADGTLIHQSYIGGGTSQGSNRSGSSVGQSNEWILKQNTKYLLRLVNGSTTDNVVVTNQVWYEEASGG